MPASMRHVPPPNVKVTEVDGWAHCTNPRCAGYGQQPVKAISELVEHTIGSRGGDGIFAMIVENTNEYLRFANNGCDENGRPDDSANDIPCEHCGGDREVTLQPRPVYQPLSGHPQDGLLHSPAFDPHVRNTPADEKQAAEMAELRKQLAELTKKVSSGDPVG